MVPELMNTNDLFDFFSKLFTKGYVLEMSKILKQFSQSTEQPPSGNGRYPFRAQGRLRVGANL